MPLTRRLAYRDRYVRLLTQTMTGGSSVLPPVQFPATGTREFIVGLTAAEWLAVFSSLMAGADLLYPDSAHEVVWSLLRNLEYPLPAIGFGFDSEITLWAMDGLVTAGNPLVKNTTTSQFYNNICLQNPALLNDTITFTRFMAAGTWTYMYLFERETTNGIVTVDLLNAGGSVVVTAAVMDLSGSTLFNAQLGGFTFVVPDSAEYTIRFKVTGRALPTGQYINRWTVMKMWRTA